MASPPPRNSEARSEDGQDSSCIQVFESCLTAIEAGKLIRRESRQDKEFHFQNWVGDRLSDAQINYDQNGRNSYPDYTLVNYPEGYEVKGLAWPGREASYDSNSRVPSGSHGGRSIFYVFGRYPANPDEDEYPVVDLVICHGDFLNADSDYVHKNKSFRGFGTYGDLLVRDRKMYVAPTPFALTEGTTGQQTLIVPADYIIESEAVEKVGELVRVETADIVIGYTFNLQTNEMQPHLAPNPAAGTRHEFVAWKRIGLGASHVAMRIATIEEDEFEEDQ